MFRVKNVFLLFYVCVICVVMNYGIRGTEMAFGEQPKGYLAIIIDDFGYGAEGTDEILSLDIDFTAAIMPFSEKTDEDLKKVQAAGKDYIVHMPMESLTGKKAWVGNKGVFISMTEEEIYYVVAEALEIVEGAAGLNNHMGSAIMENERCLNAVLKAVKENDIMFIDSMTTASSLGEKLGEENGIFAVERDVFLDSTDDKNEVKKRLKQAADIVFEKGYAVAIGHVGPEGGIVTYQAINEMKDELEKNGIEFVTVSRLREMYESGRNN